MAYKHVCKPFEIPNTFNIYTFFLFFVLLSLQSGLPTPATVAAVDSRRLPAPKAKARSADVVDADDDRDGGIGEPNSPDSDDCVGPTTHTHQSIKRRYSSRMPIMP